MNNWIVDVSQNGPYDRPIVLPLESGVMRPVQILWAEREPAGYGFVIAWGLVVMGLYADSRAFSALIFVVLWHLYWVQAAKRDPRYCAIMVRNWWQHPWPSWLSGWPEVGARRVRLEPSVPFRGDAILRDDDPSMTDDTELSYTAA